MSKSKGKPKRVIERKVIDRAGDIVAGLVSALAEKGSARLVHFGQFTVREVRGKKRYSFAGRCVVETKPYQQITFTPARGVHEMLQAGRMKVAGNPAVSNA